MQTSATERFTSTALRNFRCPAPDCHCVISEPLVALAHHGFAPPNNGSDTAHQGRTYTVALPLAHHQPTSALAESADTATENLHRVFCPTCFTAVLHCACCGGLVLDLPAEDEVHCMHCGYLVIDDSVLPNQQVGMPPNVLRAIQLQLNERKFMQAIHDVFERCATAVVAATASATATRGGPRHSSQVRQFSQATHGHGYKRRPSDFDSPLRGVLDQNGGVGDMLTEDESDYSAAAESCVKRRRVDDDGRSPPGTLLGRFISPLDTLRTGERMARPPCVRRPRAMTNPQLARDSLLVACHHLRLQLADPQVRAMDEA
jgi:hypothetical protein